MKVIEKKRNVYRKLHWYEDEDTVLSAVVAAVIFFVALLFI